MKKMMKIFALTILLASNVVPTVNAIDVAGKAQAYFNWNGSLDTGTHKNVTIKGLENTYYWVDKNGNQNMDRGEFDDPNGNGIVDQEEVTVNNLGVVITDGIRRIIFCLDPDTALNEIPNQGYGTNPAWEALSPTQQINVINYIQYGMNLFDKKGGIPKNIIDANKSNDVGADYLMTIQTMIWDEVTQDGRDFRVAGVDENRIESEIKAAIEQGKVRPSFTVTTNEDASLNTSPVHTLKWDESLGKYVITLTDENGVYDSKYKISDGRYGDYKLVNLGNNKIQITTETSDAAEFEFTHLNTDGLEYKVNPYADDDFLLIDYKPENQDVITFGAYINEYAKFKVNVEPKEEEEKNPSYDIVKEVVSGEQEHNTINDDTVDGDMTNNETSREEELITMGDNAKYSIVATNTGDVDIKPAVVTDSFEAKEFENAKIAYNSVKLNSNLRGDITNLATDNSDYNADMTGKPSLELVFDLLVGEEVTITFEIDFDETMLEEGMTFDNFAFINENDPNIELPPIDDPADLTPERIRPNNEIPQVERPSYDLVKEVVSGVKDGDPINDDKEDFDGTNDESTHGQEIITVGDNATYTLVATNNGNVDICVTGTSLI